MKNLFFATILAGILLSVVFCFAAGKTVKSYWYDESKTILEINDLNDFAEFQRLLRKEDFTFEGKEIHLKRDIIVFDTTGSNNWSQKIVPRDFTRNKIVFENNILDRSITEFRGKFDGNGHYIMGLYGRPLFGNIKNAEIKNLNISHSHFFNASIAVKSKNSIIKNCNVFANVSADKRNYVITNVLLSSPVGIHFSGGYGIMLPVIIGLHSKRTGFTVGALASKSNGSTIKNNSFDGIINGINSTGGIVGVAKNSTQLDSNNVSGIIIGKARKTDSIAGYMSLSSIATRNKFSSEIVEKSRFTYGYETGYSFGLGNYGISYFGTLDYFAGVMINRHFSLSLGSGAPKPVTAKRTNGIKYSWGDNEKDVLEKVIENERRLPKDDILYNGSEILLPIFLRPRIYFSEKSISPFIDADVGVMLCWGDYMYKYKNPPGSNYSYRYKYESGFYPSFYFNQSVGAQMRFFTVSLGLKFGGAKYQKLLPGEDGWNLENLIDTYESGGMVEKTNGAVSLKIGVSF
ncbi:MAG: hypothetical protein FWF51_05560 [Chitinivibrionia bacterium]|nr:hypothetical protein [Chitinivibrionia bacterium]